MSRAMEIIWCDGGSDSSCLKIYDCFISVFHNGVLQLDWSNLANIYLYNTFTPGDLVQVLEVQGRTEHNNVV